MFLSALVPSIAYVAIQHIYMVCLSVCSWFTPSHIIKFMKVDHLSVLFQLWIFNRCVAQNRCVVNICRGFPGGSGVKNLLAKQETWVRSLDWEDPLANGRGIGICQMKWEMATHFSLLAWEIPRVRHDLATIPPPPQAFVKWLNFTQ